MSIEPLDLAEKLLTTLHLNVRERSSLPPNGMPFSLLVQAAKRVLEEHRFMPPQWHPRAFTGILLELQGESIVVHERYEVGVGRLSPVESKKVDDLPTAVRMFVKANGGDSVDGVRICFDA